MKRIEVFGVATVVCFAVDLVFLIYFGNFLILNRPSVQNDIFTIAFDAHGVSVFISKVDYAWYYCAEILSYLLGVLAAILYISEFRKR